MYLIIYKVLVYPKEISVHGAEGKGYMHTGHGVRAGGLTSQV